jgi:hypothetical protein
MTVRASTRSAGGRRRPGPRIRCSGSGRTKSAGRGRCWSSTGWSGSTRASPTSASPARCPTPSACTRRTSGSPGSTTTCSPAPPRPAACGAWSSRPSSPSATTTTGSSGTCTSTAGSSWRSRLELERLPTGPDNPHGNAFTRRVTRLRRESDGVRTADASVGRAWQVVNPARTNRLGQPVAYALDPPARPAARRRRRRRRHQPGRLRHPAPVGHPLRPGPAVRRRRPAQPASGAPTRSRRGSGRAGRGPAAAAAQQLDLYR